MSYPRGPPLHIPPPPSSDPYYPHNPTRRSAAAPPVHHYQPYHTYTNYTAPPAPPQPAGVRYVDPPVDFRPPRSSFHTDPQTPGGYLSPHEFGFADADPSLYPASSRRRARSRAKSRSRKVQEEEDRQSIQSEPLSGGGVHHYEGRRRSGKSNHRGRSSRRGRDWPPGYRPPTVESAPASPVLTGVLPSDHGSVFEEDEEWWRDNKRWLEEVGGRLPWVSEEEEKDEKISFKEFCRRQRGKWEAEERERQRPKPERKRTSRLGLEDGGLCLERKRNPYSGGGGGNSMATERERTPESSPEMSQEEVVLERRRMPYGSSKKEDIIDGMPTPGEDLPGAWPVEMDREKTPYSYAPGGAYRVEDDGGHGEQRYHDHDPEQYLDHNGDETEGSEGTEEEGYESERDHYEQPPPVPPQPPIGRTNSGYSTSSQSRTARGSEANYDDRRRSGYASTGNNLSYSREDMRSSVTSDTSSGYPTKEELRNMYEPPTQPYRADPPPQTYQPPPPPPQQYHPSPPQHHYHEMDHNGSTNSNHHQYHHSSPPHSHHSTPPTQPSPPGSHPPHPADLVHIPTSDSLTLHPKAPSEFLDLIPSCPKRRMVTRGEWYIIPRIPNFHVCERCYELYIFDTIFDNEFQPITLPTPATPSAYCAFNTPRILEIVWPAALQHQSFEIFESYALSRSQVTNCSSASRSASGTWYRIDPHIPRAPGLIACEACFEDVISGSDFAGYFKRIEAINPDGLTSCHISVPYIEAQLLDKNLTWPQFLRNVEYRLKEVTPCPLDRVISDPERRWWKPLDTDLPIMICDSCYCDGIVPTQYYDEFQLTHSNSAHDKWFCAMGAFQLTVVWKHAVEKDDIDLWIEAAEASLSPICSSDGKIPSQSSKDWYTLSDPELAGFHVCGRCVRTYFEPLGFGNQTVEAPPLPASSDTSSSSSTSTTPPRVCGFSSHYRFDLVSRLATAADWRDWTLFRSFLIPRIAKQLCPGAKEAVRERWYGSPDLPFRVCEECYRFRVRPYPAVDQVVEPLPLLSGQAGERGRCDLGEEEGRRFWEVAKRRDGGTGGGGLQVLGWFCEVKDLRRVIEELRRNRREAEREVEEIREWERQEGVGRGGGGRGVQEEMRRLVAEMKELRDSEERLVGELRVLMSG